MDNQTSRYLELLELWITLLDSLSETLMAARAAIVAFDIESLESHVAEQQQLCREMQALHEEVARLEYQCAAHLRLRGGQDSASRDAQLEDALQRLQQAQANVKRLNEVHQNVLCRSQRTIVALLHSLRTFDGSYQETAMLQATKRAGIQEQA